MYKNHAMFTRKDDGYDTNAYVPSSPGPVGNAAAGSASGTSPDANIITKGTLIQGDLYCEGDLRVDGQVKGTIRSKAKVMIGSEGLVEGDVECVRAEVLGSVKGSLKVQDLLYLRGNAKMDGDVLTTHLEMEPTVRFNGKCTMQDKVELSSFNHKQEKPQSAPASPAKSAPTKDDGEKETKSVNGLFQKQAAV